MIENPSTDRREAILWLAAAAVLGTALAIVFPDAHQQDGGNHFLFARFAANEPSRFVGVWTRPLFTTLYFLPAQLGYLAAKLFTLLIALLTAWLTYRFAAKVGVARPSLAIALLFLQPSLLLLSTETMTEPLFALLFIIALHLREDGHDRAAALVASLLALVRPEGFILGAFFGLAILLDGRRFPRLSVRIGHCALLGIGFVLWWFAALVITGDPLYIKHNWPREWSVTEQTYGSGSAATYLLRLPEYAGPILAVFFIRGIVRAIRSNTLASLVAPFLALFVVHSILRATGSLGSAGYPRYFVCVAPAIAILTLRGLTGFTRPKLFVAIFLSSALAAIFYLDFANFEGRDSRAIRAMKQWFDQQPRPYSRVVWSHAYMGIVFDRDPSETPPFGRDRESNLERIRDLPKGTIVFWDALLGPDRFQLQAEDFLDAGFEQLHNENYHLRGWWRADLWNPKAQIREQSMHLLYKSDS